MNASISVRDFHFLAAYTAVNNVVENLRVADNFLAAYTAVNGQGFVCGWHSIFLAAYTAVNESTCRAVLSAHFLAAYTAVNRILLDQTVLHSFLSCLHGSEHDALAAEAQALIS